MNKSSIFFFFCCVMFFLYLGVFTAQADDYLPPPPDKNKTLAANDGDQDGCNSSRFECVLGGEAVLDRQTGLIWTRNTNLLEQPVGWDDAQRISRSIAIGNKKWRLPTRDEMISLLDTSESDPALPAGHPFHFTKGSGGVTTRYWTSDEYVNDNQRAWVVSLNLGKVHDSLKVFEYRIWPVTR